MTDATEAVETEAEQEVDKRARAPLNGKVIGVDIDLYQLDQDLGGYGLCGSDDDVRVADEGSPVTAEQLAAAIAAHRPAHRPLDKLGTFATLNVVLGVWPLADAANIVGLPEQSLIDEADSWAVAT